MDEIEQIFFELIRVAIGTQESLSRLPSEAEWMEVFEMAVKQSLVGVCFVGLQRLGADADDGFEKIGMSEGLYLNWMGMAAQINMKNDVVNEQCVELQKRLEADGLRSSILKGQAVAMLYGEELRGFRQSGDIDIYVDCGRERAIEYARSIQGDVNWDYKHLHLKVFDGPSTGSGTAAGTEVEMHYVTEVFLNLRKNRKLQKWFKEPEVQGSMFQVCPSTGSGTNFTTPSVEFNLFYILLHTYRHFLYEGVGMRQLMDYYFVLRNNDVDEPMRQRTIKTVSSFGMTRFASGVMWIMKDVFGISEQLLLCNPNEKEGRYILNEVMTGGNFGHHDERLKDAPDGKIGAVMKILKHNCHILLHYPGEALWAPVWVAYHWCWKRFNKY